MKTKSKYMSTKQRKTMNKFVRGLGRDQTQSDGTMRSTHSMNRNCCSEGRKTKFGWRYRLARKAEKRGIVVFDSEKWCFMCGRLRKVFIIPTDR